MDTTYSRSGSRALNPRDVLCGRSLRHRPKWQGGWGRGAGRCVRATPGDARQRPRRLDVRSLSLLDNGRWARAPGLPPKVKPYSRVTLAAASGRRRRLSCVSQEAQAAAPRRRAGGHRSARGGVEMANGGLADEDSRLAGGPLGHSPSARNTNAPRRAGRAGVMGGQIATRFKGRGGGKRRLKEAVGNRLKSSRDMK